MLGLALNLAGIFALGQYYAEEKRVSLEYGKKRHWTLFETNCSRTSRLSATPLAPCDVYYLVPMLIAC